MPVQLDSIAFNWGGTAQNSALRIRRDYATAINVPEWTRAGTNEPSAYANAQIQAGGNVPQIRVALSGAEAGEIVTISATGNGTPLGDIAAQEVTFDAHGRATVQMPLAHCTIGAATVGIVNTTWTWSAVEGGGVPYQFATTTHRSYLLLDTPSQPWTQNGGDQDPWAVALEVACTYAQGAGNTTAAATQITTSLNACGAAYNPAPSFGLLNGRVWLSGFLAFLPLAGFGLQMNCFDCGAIVMLLSNLVGGAFWSGRFVNAAGGTMPTLPINGMGHGATWSTYNWTFHEVCWVQFATNSQIYDAAARVNSAAPVLPRNMQFDTAYRPLLTNANVQTSGPAQRYAVQ
jgi:hypothetical protein